MTVPTILRMKIERFRGLIAMDWSPSAGLNLILGSSPSDPLNSVPMKGGLTGFQVDDETHADTGRCSKFLLP